MTLEEFVAQLTPDSVICGTMPYAISFVESDRDSLLVFVRYISAGPDEYWSILTVEEQLYFALLILEAEGR